MADPKSQALFRFSIVSQVLARMHRGERRAQAVRTVADGWHHPIDGAPRRVGERSIYRWLKGWEDQGWAGLDAASDAAPRAAVLPTKLVEFLARARDDDEHASIPELIRRARECGIVGPNDAICRTTVYRTLRRRGISVARRKRASERDARRFAYPHRMDMVLSDGKHFRAGVARQKRLAMFFLDDATRAGLHVVVGTSETAALFQRGLFECISRFGFMTVIYLDHGPGFIALDTAAVIKSLEILLIHGETAYPEGHGKIERFHLTAIGDVLRNLDGRADVDPDCRALELRLQHYLAEQYGHRGHESLQQETPWQRFHRDAKPLRFPESVDKLRAHFEVWIERRVSPDGIVSISSVFYELPRGYAGQRVTLHRRLLDGTIGFLHQGRLIELQPVDLQANAHSRRARAKSPAPDPRPTPPPSAADLAYLREFGPIVEDDGGFHGNDPSQDRP